MKKLFLFFTVFSSQLNHNSYTPRIKRQCHLRYTDEHFRNDLGNRYLRETLEQTRKQKYLNQSQIQQQTQTSRCKSAQPRKSIIPDQNLNSILTIQSILPSLYHPPKIYPFEILPKR